MLDLTFGEQVKIILRRKGMTIKELAEKMEEHTGKKMSRQNLTQRLGRDNFQEQDMREIAAILGCRFQLSIMEESSSAEKNFKEKAGSDYAASRGEYLNGIILANYLGYEFIDAAEVIFFDDNAVLCAANCDKNKIVEISPEIRIKCTNDIDSFIIEDDSGKLFKYNVK